MQTKLIVLVILLELLPFKVNSQKNIVKQLESNDRQYTLSSEKILEIYTSEDYNEFEYIYGKEYKVKYIIGRSTPYLNNSIGQGVIYSKQYAYDNLMLMFDINKEALVSLTQKYGISAQHIELNDAAIDSFEITFNKVKYNFQNLTFQEDEKDVMEDGYYEVYPAGKLKLYVKHIVQTTYNEGLEKFVFDQKFFLKRDGVYYPVTARKQLLKLFWDKKKPLKKQIRSYKLSYKRLPVFDMVDLVDHVQKMTYN